MGSVGRVSRSWAVPWPRRHEEQHPEAASKPRVHADMRYEPVSGPATTPMPMAKLVAAEGAAAPAAGTDSPMIDENTGP